MMFVVYCIQRPFMPIFLDIHAVDRWRVVLRGETPDYINATNVHVSFSILYHITEPLAIHHRTTSQGYKRQRAFIITQGPMQSTARDFWKMVYDRECKVIVMLSDLVEGGQVRIIAT